MKRLLVISINRDPLGAAGGVESGGQANFLLQLSQWLAGCGWFIDILTAQWARQELISEITYGVRVLRLSPPNDISALDVTGCRELTEIVIADEQLLKPSYSLMLACYWQSFDVALRLREVHGWPLVLRYASLGAFKQKAYPDFHMSERIQLEREAGIQADAVIALSKSEREALITDYGLDPAKLAVIPNGVDLERFYEDPKAPVHRQA